LSELNREHEWREHLDYAAECGAYFCDGIALPRGRFVVQGEIMGTRETAEAAFSILSVRNRMQQTDPDKGNWEAFFSARDLVKQNIHVITRIQRNSDIDELYLQSRVVENEEEGLKDCSRGLLDRIFRSIKTVLKR